MMMSLSSLLPRLGFGLVVAGGCIGCGSDAGEPSPRTETEAWLQDHPVIMSALVWDAGDGRGAQPYPAWSTADRITLDRAVSDAKAGTEPKLVDPPANLVANRLANDFAAATAISNADARGLYFSYVGRSLMLEMTGALPWSIADYDANVTDRAILDPTSMVSWVVPTPPEVAASFLSASNIVASTRLETITRLLEWERTHLPHFSGAFTFPNVFDHWQYSGVPPASRIIDGTMKLTSSLLEERHWTAGCPARTRS